MARVFTQEEREEVKARIVELVRQSGRETLRQLEAKTGATRYLMSVLARELVASGDVYNSGYGLFPSEQARKDWQNARKKLSRAKLKKPSAVDPDLIWSLPDGEIRRYDSRLNIICRECRKSEVMQRVLAFYQGNFQEAVLRVKLAIRLQLPLAFASKERSMEIKPEDELSNIVLFPVKEDDPRNQVNFLYEPSERPYCHHASVRVDEKERQVRCKICGAVVEPFDWMLSVAKRETRLADDVRLLRQEEQERRKNIEKLIQIERNAKARIRRVTKSRTE